MQSVKIPKTAATNALGSLFGSNGSIATNSSIQTLVRFYSGTMPTMSQLDTMNLPGTVGTTINTLATSLGAVLLWESIYSSSYGVAVSSGNGFRMPDSAYATATASGVATWFVVASTNTPSAVTTNTTLSDLFIGSISNTTGNGDLRLSDNNIVAGAQYRVGPFLVNLPYESNF
jgi:hypothetical protein